MGEIAIPRHTPLSKGRKYAMIGLKWHQVHAWRLSATWPLPRFSSQDFIQAVTRTGGIQAQVMSAAELALCTRVEGLSPRLCPIRALAGTPPGEDLGDARHLTLPLRNRSASVCSGA